MDGKNGAGKDRAVDAAAASGRCLEERGSPDPLIAQSGILLWNMTVSGRVYESLGQCPRRTLPGCIDDLDEAHFVVDEELFAVSVFNSRVIGLV